MRENIHEIHVHGSVQGMIVGEHASGISCFSQTSPPHRTDYQNILGTPVLTDPLIIQQRPKLINTILNMLTQPQVNALVLTGIGGAGKSTLAALLYRQVETHRLYGSGPFSAPPLWLSINATATFADLITTLYQALEMPLPDLNSLSPARQASLLFAALSSAPARLIVLDQFDFFLHWQTGQALPTQNGIEEWIDVLNSQSFQSECRLLLTSRSFPKGSHLYPPLHIQPYQVSGLTIEECIDLFRLRKIDANELELCEAATSCHGHALSLALLIALVREYGLRLTQLLADPALWQGDIATQLLDVIFHRLSPIQRQILCAFSIYRMPVPIEAIQLLLHEDQIRSVLPALRALLTQHLILIAEEGNYYPHVIIATYAQHRFIEEDEQANLQAFREAHTKAAQFSLQQAKTYTCSPQKCYCHAVLQLSTEAVWHYTQAQQRQKAYDFIIQEDLFVRLEMHYEYNRLLEVSQWLLQQDDVELESAHIANISCFLGKAYDILGQKKQAICYYEKSLKLYQETQDIDGVRQMLNYLGNVYQGMSKAQEALQYYEQSHALGKGTDSLQEQGTLLYNIGGVYQLLGNFPEALRYYQQVLTITRQTEDPLAEGSTLNDLGEVYRKQGELQQAHDYYLQALILIRSQGDRHKEGIILNNVAGSYADLGDPQRGLDHGLQALMFIQVIGDLQVEGNIHNTLGHIYHCLGKPKKALDHYQQSLLICREVENRHFESSTLANIASLHRDTGKIQAAIKYYAEALTIFHELDDLAKKASTCYKIGSLFSDLGKTREMLHYYEQALGFYKEIGDKGNEGMLLNNIAYTYRDIGNLQKALNYYEKALIIYQQTNDHHNECIILNNIGSIYHDLAKTSEALNYLQQAHRQSCEAGNSRVEGITLSNIGEIYEEQGDLQSALIHYQKALALYREVKDRLNEGVALNNIGLIYNILEEDYKALDCYRQSLPISRELHDYDSELTILCNIGLLFLEQQLYEAAISALILMKRVSRRVSKPRRYVIHRYSHDLQKVLGKVFFLVLKTQLESKAEQTFEQALNKEMSDSSK